MKKAVIFDLDGTLIDSVDLHALAWHEAFAHFGHAVSFEDARSQIGKGGDQLIPVFLSQSEQEDYGERIVEWRAKRFRTEYLPMVRPFAAVPELLMKIRGAGARIAIASSAKQAEARAYLRLANITQLVDQMISAEDADRSKPSPDVFNAALDRLHLEAGDVIAIGDTPYDAEAARKAGISVIGFLCGGFTEHALRQSGCAAVYPGPAALLACLNRSNFTVN